MVWKAPATWHEHAGSGFRLASFEAGEAECAIIAFPEAMGGTDAKISMWLGQLGAATPPPEKLVSFIARPESLKTADGLTCDVYDLAGLIGPAPAQSILAGIIDVEGKQVAVRLKGTPAALAAQKAAFLELCASLRKKPRE